MYDVSSSCYCDCNTEDGAKKETAEGLQPCVIILQSTCIILVLYPRLIRSVSHSVPCSKLTRLLKSQRVDALNKSDDKSSKPLPLIQ